MVLRSRSHAALGGSNEESGRRNGFTLTELIVALMLLTVGLLALASTSAFLTYEYAAAGRAESAAIIAESRLETLRLAGCTAVSGAAVSDGFGSTWSVAIVGTTALATVAVTWTERGESAVQRYATGFVCR